MIRKYRSELTEYNLGIMEKDSVGKRAILLNPGPCGVGSVGAPHLTAVRCRGWDVQPLIQRVLDPRPGTLHMYLTELC